MKVFILPVITAIVWAFLIIYFLLIGGVNQIAAGGTGNIVWGIIRIIAIPAASYLGTVIFAIVLGASLEKSEG